MICSTFKTNCSLLLTLVLSLFSKKRKTGGRIWVDMWVMHGWFTDWFTVKERETPYRVGQDMRLMVQEHSHHPGEQVQCALAMYTELSQDKQNSSRTSSWYIIFPEIKKLQAEVPSFWWKVRCFFHFAIPSSGYSKDIYCCCLFCF